MWFGLLFFAVITSSLARGQPILAFLEDEHAMPRKKAAGVFGLGVLALGFVCVWLYSGGSFDEFDFWTGTFSLVVFAMLEVFIFVHIFGIDRGWAEITRGADMKVPYFFKHVIHYVTPVFITVIFVGALIQPAAPWGEALAGLFRGEGWQLAPGSVIGKVVHAGDEGYAWFAGGEPTRAFVQDMTRVLLLVVFTGFALLVRQAFRRKEGTV